MSLANPRFRSRFARYLFAALFIAVAVAVGAWAIWHKPRAVEPDPNGLTLLLKLSSGLGEGVKDISRTNKVERDQFVRAHSELVQLVRAALTNELSSRRLDTDDDFGVFTREMMNLRRLSHALSLVADYHIDGGDKDSAVDIFCLQLEIGCRSYRNGLAIQYLVGTAIGTGAFYDLNDLVPKLEPSAAVETARRLTAIASRRDTVGDVLSRERNWMWFKTPWWKSIDGIKAAGASLFSSSVSTVTRNREKWFLTLQSNVVTRLELRGKQVTDLPEPVKIPML